MVFFVTVPHVKIEPSTFLDVGLVGPIDEKLTNGYYDDEWIVNGLGKCLFCLYSVIFNKL